MSMDIRTLIVLGVAVAVCLASCRNGNQENSDGAAQETEAAVVTEEVQDTAVVVTETDDLRLYKLAFGSIGLELEPEKADNRIFMAAAAYTKTYKWTEFDNNLIAGPHVDGEFYDGYEEHANSGAFYYASSSDRWGFVYDGFEKALKEGAAKDGYTCGFSQVMLVSDGFLCDIHPNAKPRKLALRRALCEIDGELYVVDSKREVKMSDFAKSLQSAGVLNALYMDMGSMKYSLYRELIDSEWIEIHPANSKTKYCTNYLVFYCED